MFEDESVDEQLPCVICGQRHQQMLMLSCVHDPCVNCAAAHYMENQPINSSVYTCSKCGQQTELDQSSVQQLQRVYYSLHPKKTTNYRRNTNSSANSFKNEPRQERSAARSKQPYQKQQIQNAPPNKYYGPPSTMLPSYTSNPKINQVMSPRYPCPDHPEEQLTYFCFTCNKSICPECAIHGDHKGHEVQTTRKAIKQIRAILMQNKQRLDQYSGMLMNQKEKQRKKAKQWSEQNKKDHQFIRKKLLHLRNLLNDKEKEFLRVSQANTQRNIEQLRIQGVAHDRQLEQMAICKRNIEIVLKKEDIVILQEFTKCDDEVSRVIQKADRQRVRNEDQKKQNPPRIIDFGQFDQDLERLVADVQGIKLISVPESQI